MEETQKGWRNEIQIILFFPGLLDTFHLSSIVLRGVKID